MTRRLRLAAPFVGVAVLAACGAEPAFDAATAAALQAEVRQTRAALEAGDSARAERELRELEARVRAAVAAGALPRERGEQIVAALRRLVATMRAEMPRPAAPSPTSSLAPAPAGDPKKDDDDKGEEQKKGEERKEDEKKDDEDEEPQAAVATPEPVLEPPAPAEPEPAETAAPAPEETTAPEPPPSSEPEPSTSA